MLKFKKLMVRYGKGDIEYTEYTYKINKRVNLAPFIERNIKIIYGV